VRLPDHGEEAARVVAPTVHEARARESQPLQRCADPCRPRRSSRAAVSNRSRIEVNADSSKLVAMPTRMGLRST